MRKEKACLKEGESKVGKVVSITGQAQAHGRCLGDGGDLSEFRVSLAVFYIGGIFQPI